MKSKEGLSESSDFKWRKTVHYSLIISILLIQVLIAGFFYTEFINRKNTLFITRQLNEFSTLENLTGDSRKELLNAQDYLHKYILSSDSSDLKSYFSSVNRLAKNLDSISGFTYENGNLETLLNAQKSSAAEIKNLKVLIDSTYQITTDSNYRTRDEMPGLKKYNFDYDFSRFDVDTETYSDSIAKKGLMGRLKDAIAGKVNVRKDSTVVRVRSGKIFNVQNMEKELDSLMNSVNRHYTKEVQKIQRSAVRNGDTNGKLYHAFTQLLHQSNGVMNIYETAIRDSKSDLEQELAVQHSKNNTIRLYLVSGLMILMFIVSILIMYFTRMAFIYEQKLNAANKQIRMNLNFKNRILGMLSHELRSPLTIIGLFIYRINKKNTDENIKEYLKSISFTSETLLMQANQILEYTKNQQIQNRLNSVNFNLKNELIAIITAIEPYIETRNNRLVFTDNIDPDVVVFSDKTKINQIFMNILGNANKFTENGTISVTVSAAPSSGDSLCLSVVVSDTGVGIAQSDLDKIFEPYYQGAISGEVENLGAGLGLCLCREIIELYPGDISVSSEPGQGTEVTFWINLKQNY